MIILIFQKHWFLKWYFLFAKNNCDRIKHIFIFIKMSNKVESGKIFSENPVLSKIIVTYFVIIAVFFGLILECMCLILFIYNFLKKSPTFCSKYFYVLFTTKCSNKIFFYTHIFFIIAFFNHIFSLFFHFIYSFKKT